MSRTHTLIKSIIRDTKSGQLVWSKQLDKYTAFNGLNMTYQWQHHTLYIGKAEFQVNHPFNQHLIDAIRATVQLDNEAMLDILVGKL